MRFVVWHCHRDNFCIAFIASLKGPFLNRLSFTSGGGTPPSGKIQTFNPFSSFSLALKNAP